MSVGAAQLNDRQRAYLLAIFSVDQNNEAYERAAWRRGRRSRPADEWPWLEYAKAEVPTVLRQKLSWGKLIDQGTASTSEALEARDLLLLGAGGARAIEMPP